MRPLLCPLVLFLLLSYSGGAFNVRSTHLEDTIRLTISHKNDSTFCTSMLGHQEFLLDIYVPKHLEGNIKYIDRYSDIEFRTNQGVWKPTECLLFPPLDGYPLLYSEQSQGLGAYLDYFLDADSLNYTICNNKVLMEARLRICVIENNTKTNHYSNIDSLYLNMPSPEENAAFQYFKSLIDESYRNIYIVWMATDPVELEDHYYVLRDSFPGTVLSDMARLVIWKFRYSRELRHKEPLPPADRAYLLETYLLLLQSKSDHIRQLAKYYYKSKFFGMDKKLE